MKTIAVANAVGGVANAVSASQRKKKELKEREQKSTW